MTVREPRASVKEGKSTSWGIYMPSFINSSQDSGERGKAKSKRSLPNDEFIARAMDEEEDGCGEAVAGRIPDEFMNEGIYRASRLSFVKEMIYIVPIIKLLKT